jgi:TPR repeat protein
MVNFSFCLRDGVGVARDVDKAYTWVRKAKSMGDPLGASVLARFLNGDGAAPLQVATALEEGVAIERVASSVERASSKTLNILASTYFQAQACEDELLTNDEMKYFLVSLGHDERKLSFA